MRESLLLRLISGLVAGSLAIWGCGLRISQPPPAHKAATPLGEGMATMSIKLTFDGGYRLQALKKRLTKSDVKRVVLALYEKVDGAEVPVTDAAGMQVQAQIPISGLEGEVRLTNLRRNTRYRIRVQAFSTESGDSGQISDSGRSFADVDVGQDDFLGVEMTIWLIDTPFSGRAEAGGIQFKPGSVTAVGGVSVGVSRARVYQGTAPDLSGMQIVAPPAEVKWVDSTNSDAPVTVALQGITFEASGKASLVYLVTFGPEAGLLFTAPLPEAPGVSRQMWEEALAALPASSGQAAYSVQGTPATPAPDTKVSFSSKCYNLSAVLRDSGSILISGASVGFSACGGKMEKVLNSEGDAKKQAFSEWLNCFIAAGGSAAAGGVLLSLNLHSTEGDCPTPTPPPTPTPSPTPTPTPLPYKVMEITGTHSGKGGFYVRWHERPHYWLPEGEWTYTGVVIPEDNDWKIRVTGPGLDGIYSCKTTLDHRIVIHDATMSAGFNLCSYVDGPFTVTYRIRHVGSDYPPPTW